MKPVAFDCVRARSLQEASDILAQAEGDAKIVAGSQSLGPMLNLRLVRPRLLVDVTGIAEMTQVEEGDGFVTLGACVTTGSIEDGRAPGRDFPALAAVAANIAYRAVRNRGTIGGSICHADPAADWLSALCGLGAQCLISGPEGSRDLPVDQFVTGAFETALGPAEILAGIRIPRPSSKARWGYSKICRKAGEFAMAIGAVLDDPERDILRMVIGATRGKPIVVTNARMLTRRSGAASHELDEKAVLRLLDEHKVIDHASRRQHVAVLRRALLQAGTP